MFQDTPLIAMLPDGRRLNMRHGPIDLIVEAIGPPVEVEAAYKQAAKSFGIVLRDLVVELENLRKPLDSSSTVFDGEVAIQMVKAARRVAGDAFCTPMIAVAGAVADHVLQCMIDGRNLRRAYVNNGGDIALHLMPGEHFDIGVCVNPSTGRINSTAHIECPDEIGGIATSGWQGRSHSFGIADAVTVLADNAAKADAAATLIANAVDLPNHPAILRTAASDLSPDSDLGDRQVTVEVGNISSKDVQLALTQGEQLAQSMIDAGHIKAAYGSLKGESFMIETMQLPTAMLGKQKISNHPVEAVHA